MRLSSTALGLAGWLLLGLLLPTGSARAESKRSRPSEGGGCLFVVVTDSATGKPLGFANCAAVDLMKGALSDSLGHCLVCGLAKGTVVLATRANWHVQRRDTVRVQRGRTDTLRVRLRRLKPAAGTVLDYSPKH